MGVSVRRPVLEWPIAKLKGQVEHPALAGKWAQIALYPSPSTGLFCQRRTKKRQQLREVTHSARAIQNQTLDLLHRPPLDRLFRSGLRWK